MQGFFFEENEDRYIFVNRNYGRRYCLGHYGEIYTFFSKLFFIKFVEGYSIILMYNLCHVLQNSARTYR